jgi:hypothetical protein
MLVVILKPFSGSPPLFPNNSIQVYHTEATIRCMRLPEVSVKWLAESEANHEHRTILEWISVISAATPDPGPDTYDYPCIFSHQVPQVSPY